MERNKVNNIYISAHRSPYNVHHVYPQNGEPGLLEVFDINSKSQAMAVEDELYDMVKDSGGTPI